MNGQHPTPEELIRLFYEDESSASAMEVRRHVVDCVDCQEIVDDWERVRKKLDLLGGNPTQMEAEKNRSSKRLSASLFWVAIAASLLIGMLLGHVIAFQNLESRLAIIESASSDETQDESELEMRNELNQLKRELGTSVRVNNERIARVEGKVMLNTRDAISALDARQNSRNRAINRSMRELARRQDRMEAGIVEVANSADKAVEYVFHQLQESLVHKRIEE